MYDIGIDVGGTSIVAGLVDADYKIVARKVIPTDRTMTAKALCDTLLDISRDLLIERHISAKAVKSIGVGVPGTANDKTGRIEYANNLPDCQGSVRPILQGMVSQKVYMENDANAAAWGEYICMTEKPESMVMITLGTGVGGGIIQSGRLVKGINYAEAEFGHMTIKFDGLPCNCGRKGCFEVYASGEALANQARKKMGKKPGSLMWDLCGGNLERMEGRLVFDAVRQGDKAAAKVLDKYVEYLSEGVANVINMLQPEVLCIGGGISRAEDLLIPVLQEKVHKKLYSRLSEKNTIIRVSRLGADAGIVGAAKLRRMK